ncbi:MAG TPA: hypothetical protein VFU57_08835 [Candidatus Acidoferrales bacterium]|nr:hypothetical protein [Candidatus Acidoferrales bacterium]
MPDDVYREEEIIAVGRSPDWGAIWAGTFSFLAIWSIFGVLGMAVFATAANPNAPRPVRGMGTGMDIWAIVLTIIAMYVAGMVTGKLAGIATARDGAVHGMAMFGLSVVGVLLILGLGESAIVGGTANGTPYLTTHSSYILSLFSSIGWVGFVAMFLGWLAAMGGASTGMKQRAERITRHEMRHAA